MNLRILFVALLAILVSAALTATAGAATFTPEADSYVNASQPTKNYGTSRAMRPDASPERNAYVRFDVTGAGPSPTATLRFYADSNHSVGLDVRAVSDTVETSLPYDFNRTIDARGYIRLSALITAVIRQPQRLPALLRLGLDCRLAARQLADFLDRYVGLLYSRLDLSQSEMAAAT